MLEIAKGRDEVHYLVLLVSYLHAMRVSEVVELRSADVTDETVLITALKGSSSERQPLLRDPDPLWDEWTALRRHARSMHPTMRLFEHHRKTIRLWVMDYAKRAGVPKERSTHHAFRHSCAQHMLEANCKLNEVQAWGRWKSLGSLGRYLKVSQTVAAKAAFTALRGQGA